MADPVREAATEVLAAYDALRDGKPIPTYGAIDRLRAALERPAAPDAEAMREASGHSGEASKRATAFVEAMDASPCPHSDADWSESDCGYCLAAALDRFAAPLPAPDDAVEEAMAPGCHEHVALWDAINAYSAACGGHPTRGGGARMDAVVRVEAALRALPLPPASAGGEVEAARLLPTTLDGVTLIRGDTLQRTIIASPDIYEAFRAAFSAERAAAKGGPRG